MDEKKSLGQMIADTEMKLSEVINNSHLAPEVLELILRNIHAQIVQIINMPKKESSDGKHTDIS